MTEIQLREHPPDFRKNHIAQIDYNEGHLEIRPCTQLAPESQAGLCRWIRVHNLYDPDLLRMAGHLFVHNPSLQEDMLSNLQNAAFKDYHECIFVGMEIVKYDDFTGILKREHVQIMLKENCLLSLKSSRYKSTFDGVLERLKQNRAGIRRKGMAFLLFVLMETIVEQYVDELEGLRVTLNKMEVEMLRSPRHALLRDLFDMKRVLVQWRYVIYPVSTMLRKLLKSNSPLLPQRDMIYFRDLLSEIDQTKEVVNGLRDQISSLLDSFLTSNNNKTNQIMRVLTIMTTLFVPLTFITSIYGMNFKYMPELQWQYGYFFMLGLHAVIAAITLRYFKRKGWF